jgi:hypothetical protein
MKEYPLEKNILYQNKLLFFIRNFQKYKEEFV